MYQLPPSITLAIAVLTLFLCFAVGLRYAIADNFRRTRFLMSAFFGFLVITLSISFWQYAALTLPYTIAAFLAGVFAGYLLGVRTEREKLMMQGIEHYMAHFAHIHLRDFAALTWWSFINFYSVMGALVLINFVGLTNVIFRGARDWVIVSCVFGAFLIGTIVPYLAHLWSISATHPRTRTIRER